MSRWHLRLTPVFLLALLLIAGTGLYLAPPAEAAPIFLEEEFDDSVCEDEETPSGWSAGGSGSLPTFFCDDVYSEPRPNAIRLTKSDFTCCPIGQVTAPTFDISGATSYSIGVNFLYTFNAAQLEGSPTPCNGGIAVSFDDTDGGFSGGGVCIDAEAGADELYISNGNGGTISTSETLVNETWYEFRFDIRTDAPNNDFDVYLNGTLIRAGVTLGSGTQDHDRLQIGLRGGRTDLFFHTEMWLDWIFIGTPTVTAPADVQQCTGAYLGDDPTVDSPYLTRTMTDAPSGFSIDSETGVISGSTLIAAVSVITLIATTSIGAASDTFTLTVISCGGGPGPIPTPGDTFDPPSCEEGSFDVLFESKYPDTQVNIYFWNFGDGTATKTTSHQAISHTFAGDGTYTVTHRVQFNDGVTWSESTLVDIGFCDDPSIGVASILSMLVALAALMWVAWVLTRRKQLMLIALGATIAAAVLGALLLAGLF